MTAPAVMVFGDDQDRSRFYAWAAAPRIKSEAGGALQFSLLIYRRGEHSPSEGGQVTLALTLAISDDERAAVASALAESGSTPPTGPGDASARSHERTSPRLTIVAPEWLSGSVGVHLTDGLDLVGRPSLSGANECSLAASLTGTQADALEAALEAGLTEGVATYKVEVGAARSDTRESEHVSESPGWSGSFRYEVAVTSADRLPLELTGPLRVSPAQRESMKTSFTL